MMTWLTLESSEQDHVVGLGVGGKLLPAVGGSSFQGRVGRKQKWIPVKINHV